MRRDYNGQWKKQIFSPQTKKPITVLNQSLSTSKHTPSKTKLIQAQGLQNEGHSEDLLEGTFPTGICVDSQDQSSVNRVQQLIRGQKLVKSPKFTDLKNAFQPSLGQNWNDSILSVLRSNENYRRQLLAVIEEKARIQAQKSEMQKQVISSSFEKDQLIAEKRQLNNKISFLNKNMAVMKEETRKQLHSLEAAIAKMKHEASMIAIEREALEKSYAQALDNCKILREQLQKEKMTNEECARELDEAKGQITFLVSKLAQNQEDHFVIEQQCKDIKRQREIIDQRLQKAYVTIQKLKGDLLRLQQTHYIQKDKYAQRLQQKECLLQQKAKQIGKYETKFKELTINLQSSNTTIKRLEDSLSSYLLIEQQNSQLRLLLSHYSELKKQRQQLVAENNNLKATKQHFETRLLDQKQLVEDLQNEYQDLVKVVQQREKEEYNRFTFQIKRLLQKNDQCESQRQLADSKLQQLQFLCSQKQKEINDQSELIERLQLKLEEKILRLSKYEEEGINLKKILEDEVKQVQEQKLKVEELDESLQQGRHHWQEEAQVSKMTILQKEELIFQMRRELSLLKIAKEEEEIRWKEGAKRWEEKHAFQVKQAQLLRSKIQQFQRNQNQLQKQLQKARNELKSLKQLQLGKSTQQLNLEQAYARLQHELQVLKQKCQQQQKSLALEQSRKLVQKDHQSELKRELKHQSQQMAEAKRKQRQNQEQYQQQLQQQQKIFQQKQRKSFEFVKSLYKQFTMAKTYISEIKSYNFHTLQKYSPFLAAGQRYNFGRQLERAMDTVSKAAPLGNKIEKALQQIRIFLEIKQLYQNEVLVRQGSIYRVNRLYSK